MYVAQEKGLLVDIKGDPRSQVYVVFGPHIVAKGYC
jgi:hypothetical protein